MQHHKISGSINLKFPKINYPWKFSTEHKPHFNLNGKNESQNLMDDLHRKTSLKNQMTVHNLWTYQQTEIVFFHHCHRCPSATDIEFLSLSIQLTVDLPEIELNFWWTFAGNWVLLILFLVRDLNCISRYSRIHRLWSQLSNDQKM